MGVFTRPFPMCAYHLKSISMLEEWSGDETRWAPGLNKKAAPVAVSLSVSAVNEKIAYTIIEIHYIKAIPVRSCVAPAEIWVGRSV